MSSTSKTDFPMTVTFEEDGNMTIEWDETHPVASVLNDWTEQDFLDCFLEAAERVLEENNGK